MPRNISFMLTTKQFLDGTKDVTRRMGWRDLKAGDILTAVEKAQGIPKGGKIKKLATIRVKTVQREPLERLLDDPVYGRAECGREGFPTMAPCDFVEFFCRSHSGCWPHTVITRIEFEKIEEPK